MSLGLSINVQKQVNAHGNSFVPRVFTVIGKTRETVDTVTIKARCGDGGVRLEVQPGQFNMLYVHGIGEIPVSISAVGSDGALIHTVRRVGPVSKALGNLRVGESFGVRGPYGTHWPLKSLHGRSVMVLAGGLGLAPLRPAIHHLLKFRDEFDDVGIYCGARSPADRIFASEFARWQKAKPRATGTKSIEARVTVDRVPDHAKAAWQGEIGVVTSLLPRSLPDPGNAAALICGPEVMMRHAVQDLLQLGIAKEHIYLSLERNMKCAVGLCGHCQLSRYFVCRDGPV
ncbi:MAG: FAD/NAD(P)-binding protein, partial [Proteobacteria bacterium]|nr:FAD/NAD(P)-binding protein [Pseudomonadota bacterium]